MASVYIPSPLRRWTNGQSRADVPARSIRELFDSLEGEFPGIKAEVCDERGEVRSYINTFINGTEIRQLGGLDTPLAETDEVSIIPAMAGGIDECTCLGRVIAWPGK